MVERAAQDELGERRAAVTRDAIRASVVELLNNEHPASISVGDVAKQAGVSTRTIYRYFPNKQALLDDVANIQLRRVEAVATDPYALFRDPERWLPELWRTFADDVASIRAQHASTAGRDLRDRRLGNNRVEVRSQYRRRFPDMNDDDLDRLVDVTIAVTSSRMFLELHDRMGWEVADAADLSVWILDAVIAKASGGTPT